MSQFIVCVCVCVCGGGGGGGGGGKPIYFSGKREHARIEESSSVVGGPGSTGRKSQWFIIRKTSDCLLGPRENYIFLGSRGGSSKFQGVSNFFHISPSGYAHGKRIFFSKLTLVI